MKFINFTIVKFSIFISLGIFTSYILKEHFAFTFKALIFCSACLGFSWLLARKQLFQKVHFGIFTYLCFFLIGFFLYQKQLPYFQKNHYSHSIENSSKTVNTPIYLEIKIKEVLKPDLFYSKYITEVIQIEKNNSTGKILLNISKKEVNKQFSIDDHLLIQAPLVEIRKPSNPHQFDYSKYMKSLGVYHQIRIFNHELLSQRKGSPTLKGIAERFRNQIIKKLNYHDFNPEVLSIMKALLLGQKRDIDKDLYQDYAAAGAIHILAVSGLHVGILYMILSLLLRILEPLPRGKFLKSFSILVFLWSFAVIAGLSPSVVRAVTMFSFFAIAQSLERPTNSFNTLFLSYFFLLLFNPLWLFHVGFQMSYLAVFFILWIQPKLYKYYLPKYYFDKLLWGIITVTISAQIGILPLSIFYFHQVPGLSLLTNLIILPFLGIILGGGLLVILLAMLDLLPAFISSSYNFIIEMLNSFISWVAQQEQFIINDIFFSEGNLISTYLLIFCSILYWKHKIYSKLILVISSLILVLGSNIWNSHKISKNQLIIFNKSRSTLIGLKEGNALRVFQNDTLKSYINDFPIKGYRISENIKTYSEHMIPKTWVYNNKKVLVIDSLALIPQSSLIDVILLTESPKINLNRLIDRVQPEQIIVDGSNYPYLKKQWKETCKKRKIPYYDIYEEGAFVFE